MDKTANTPRRDEFSSRSQDEHIRAPRSLSAGSDAMWRCRNGPRVLLTFNRWSTGARVCLAAPRERQAPSSVLSPSLHCLSCLWTTVASGALVGSPCPVHPRP